MKFGAVGVRNKYILVFGSAGVTSQQWSNSIERYNAETNTWIKLDLKLSANYHFITALNMSSLGNRDEILIFCT